MNRKAVYVQFVKFLEQDISSYQGKNDDVAESLGVAKECIESALDITEDDKTSAEAIDFLELLASKGKTVLSAEDKEKADSLKFQGNKCLQANLLQEAIECYTQAITIDPNDSVYYCNRAAAFTNSQMYEVAVADCLKALSINPNYGKAYGRLGLVYANQNNFNESVRCYKKAVELDPNNDGYKQNLSMAEAKVGENEGDGAASSSTASQNPTDFASLLSNPALLNIAGQLMSNTQMRDQMAGMLNSYFSGQPTEGQPPSAAMDMNSVMRMGQEFAQQMSATNPELLDNLRERFQSTQSEGGTAEDSQPTQESKEDPPPT